MNKLWSNERIVLDWEIDGKLIFRTGGCGCCSQDEVLTKEMLEKHIEKTKEVLSNLEDLLLNWDEQQKIQNKMFEDELNEP